VGIDKHRQSCIELFRDKSGVHFIALEPTGFIMPVWTVADFETRYKQYPAYPVVNAAALYAAYAEHLGATPDVIKTLGLLTVLDDTRVKEPVPAKPAKKSEPVKAPKSVVPKPVAIKVVPIKTVVTPGAKDVPKIEPCARRTAVSLPAKKKYPPDVKNSVDLIKYLIVSTKMSDEDIFDEVHSIYNAFNKPGTVRMLRNNLKPHK
jgi:hypothetical protein